MRKPISKPWTNEEMERLRALIGIGASAIRCSAALKKQVSSIKIKARALGLPLMGVRETKRNNRAKIAAAEINLPPGSWRNDGSRSH